MKLFNRVLALLAALMLCLVPVLGAVAEATTEAAAEIATEPAGEETAEEAGNLDDVLLTVNGVAISRAAVDLAFGDICAYFSSYGYDVTQEALQPLLMNITYEEIVWQTIVDLKCEELGLTLTEEETATATEAALTNWRNDMDAYLTMYGMTFPEDTDEATKEEMRNALAASFGMGQESYVATSLQNAQMEKLLTYLAPDVTVTEEEVVTAYEEQVASDKSMLESVATANNLSAAAVYTYYAGQGQQLSYVPEGIRGVIHILLPVEEELLNNYVALSDSLAAQEAGTAEEGATPVTAEEVEAARLACIASVQPTIDEINQKLADGVSFEEVMAEYGTDPGMTREPNMSQGYSVAKDDMQFIPEFTAAAWSVDNVGDVAEPVMASYGVHIVKYLRDVPAGAVELTEATKAEMSQSMLASKRSEVLSAQMEVWQGEALIVYSEEAQAVVDAATGN